MTIQLINTGAVANDGTGDTARTAFDKVNDNFSDAANAASKLVATEAQAKAGTAGVLPDAAGVKSYVDQFGIGVTSLSAVADLDTLTVSGIYRSNNTTANSPAEMHYTTVTHSVRASGEMTQLAVNVTGVTRIGLRSKAGGIWSAWEYLNPTVGTVSQSGGIPTGAIIESGSNANGYYEKLASGFIIQYHSVSSSQAISTADSVNGFVSATQTWTYPVPMASVVSYQATGISANVQFHTSVGTSSASYRWTAVSSQGAATRSAGLLVIGRWF